MKRELLSLLFCLSVVPYCMGQELNLFIVTEDGVLEEKGAGFLGDWLRSQGHTVTVDAGAGTTSDYHGVLEDDEIAYLESFDVVIVHRSISSGSFNDAPYEWNELRVPLFCGSGYLTRNTRWFWMDTSHQRTIWDELDIQVPDHPVVGGLGNKIYEYPLDIDHNAPGDVGEGTVIASIVNDSGEEAPVIVAWGPDDAFTAAGGEIHTQARLFLPILRYHEANDLGNTSDPLVDGDFENYTADGLQMIEQGIQWLNSFNEPSSIETWDLH